MVRVEYLTLYLFMTVMCGVAKDPVCDIKCDKTFKQDNSIQPNSEEGRNCFLKIRNNSAGMLKSKYEICNSEEKNETDRIEDLAMAVLKRITSGGLVAVNNSTLCNDTKAPHKWIPVEFFLNVSDKESKIVVVVCDSDEQFTLKLRNGASKHIGIKVSWRDIVNLDYLLIIKFPINKTTATTTYSSQCEGTVAHETFVWVGAFYQLYPQATKAYQMVTKIKAHFLQKSSPLVTQPYKSR